MPRFSFPTIILLSLLHATAGAQEDAGHSPAGNEEVQRVMENFKGRGVMRGDAPLTPPSEVLKTFTLREDVSLTLKASEPLVEQPLYMSWDSRGRLWVTLYRQYQFPAGLKILSYDQHLRAVFDSVPKPPPHGIKGKDQVVVLEDTDQDGLFDQRRVVIDGLNIATAAIRDRTGIWVLNPPYLLFYPDADDDDVPDSDPEVMLSGFGLEDTHAVANSLQFGPDGWLYGVTGSTTTSNISSKITKNVRFEGQHVWRFHPKTHLFEVYAEGGGNTFSLEIDGYGRFFSGTNGSARGIHFDQGMSGVKNFGKHGPADNPYAFGYFNHLPTKSDNKRFSQAFCIYEGGDPELSKTLAGRIVAPNSLHHFVYVSRLISTGSTFCVEDDPVLLSSSDPWFRPVDIKVGPDGNLWIADWYDTRLSHVSPVDDWHKTSGRIYQVSSSHKQDTENHSNSKNLDLHQAFPTDLLKYLRHPNKWVRRQAALELNWRNAREVLPDLEKLCVDHENAHALDALFALHMLGGLRDDLVLKLLNSPNPYVRRWTIRCLGDAGNISINVAAALRETAQREKHPEVRSQMLCSLRRIPASESLPILRLMLGREEDLNDPRIPLLLWWAVESKSVSNRNELLAWFDESSLWDNKLARDYVIHHLAKRWALGGETEDFNACAELLRRAPRDADRTLVIQGITSAYAGTKMPVLPPSLQVPIETHLKKLLDDDLVLALQARDPQAAPKAIQLVQDAKQPIEKRVALLEALSNSQYGDLPKLIISIFKTNGDIPLKRTALQVAARYDDETLPKTVAANYEARFAGDPALRDAVHRMFASRSAWIPILLDELDANRIKVSEVAVDVVQQIRVNAPQELQSRINKLWPPPSTLLASEQAAELARIKQVISSKKGDPEKGHALFEQRCMVCHKLFAEGGVAGPDLTGYERNNLEFWLTAILDPNAEIREGYGTYIAKLKNEQILSGILEKQDATGILLRDLAGQPHAIPSSELKQLDASPVSLMPPGLLQGLSDEDLQNLFAYLMKDS